MERRDVLRKLELAADYFLSLAPHLGDEVKEPVQGVMNALGDLSSPENLAINLNELPEDKAAALREMFGPFANVVETLAAVLDGYSLEGDVLTVYGEIPIEELLK